MPLRDHFRPPVWNMASREGFHGMWPATIVQRLVPQLPPEYTAEPRVHLGTYDEIDVCAYETDEPRQSAPISGDQSAGLTTATWAPP